jgi:hypothetical protein
MVGLTTVTFEERKGREQEEDEVAASCLLSKHQKKKNALNIEMEGVAVTSSNTIKVTRLKNIYYY